MPSSQTPADSNATLTPVSNSDPADVEKNVVNVEEGAVKGLKVDVDSSSSQDEDEDAVIVRWDSDDDPQNPMNWSQVMKWLSIALISLSSFNVYVSMVV